MTVTSLVPSTMVTTPPSGVMPIRPHPSGNCPSVTSQVTPTGISKVSELTSVAPAGTVRLSDSS